MNNHRLLAAPGVGGNDSYLESTVSYEDNCGLRSSAASLSVLFNRSHGAIKRGKDSLSTGQNAALSVAT